MVFNGTEILQTCFTLLSTLLIWRWSWILFEIQLQFFLSSLHEFFTYDVLPFLSFRSFLPMIFPFPELRPDVRIIRIDSKFLQQGRSRKVFNSNCNEKRAERIKLILSQLLWISQTVDCKSALFHLVKMNIFLRYFHSRFNPLSLSFSFLWFTAPIINAEVVTFEAV